MVKDHRICEYWGIRILCQEVILSPGAALKESVAFYSLGVKSDMDLNRICVT